MKPIFRVLFGTIIITAGFSIGYAVICLGLIAYGASPAGNTITDYLGYGAGLGLLMSLAFAVNVFRGKW